MNKLAILVTIMFAAGLASLKVMEYPSRPMESKGENLILSVETAEKVVKYQAFKGTLNAALEALVQDKISLADATLRVHGAARQYCPIYLDRTRVAERGKTPEERVARNLVGHIASLIVANPGVARRVAALESELADFVRESENRHAN